MKTFRDQAHQGDVYLRRVDALPPGVTAVPPREDNRTVLALGETSGHHHSLIGPQVALFRDDGAGGAFYLRVTETTPLDHLTGGNAQTGEHAPITVAPGIYALPPQMEWTDADEPIQAAD